MNDRCEEVRARLPELAAGSLRGEGTAWLEAHLWACESCAAELRLVRALGAHEVALPAGLETRVRSALDEARRPRRRLPVARLAMAATVAFALITATLLAGGDDAGENGPDAPAGTQEGLVEAPAWPAVDEPLMRGGPALYQLSVEELEMLLQELES